MPTPRQQLAGLLRQARIDAGYKTHQAFAKKINVSRSLVAKAESATQPLPSDLALTAWGEVTDVDMAACRELVKRAKSGTPEWFIPFREAEAAASILRYWSPMLVPGPAQTPGYMRALFEAEGHPLDQIEELTAARLERQAVFGSARITMIIGPQVLHCAVGSAEIMTEQCAFLASLAETSGVALHVIPDGMAPGLGGALSIAVRASVATVCLSTTLEDIATTAPDQVDKAALIFDRLLGAALPCAESLEVIRAMEERWKAQTWTGASPATADRAAITASKSPAETA